MLRKLSNVTDLRAQGAQRVVLQQPDAPDGRPWLLCELQPVAGMPTYAVVSSHVEQADALAHMLCPELRPLFRAVRKVSPWLERDGDRIVQHVRRLAQALAAEGYGVRRIEDDD